MRETISVEVRNFIVETFLFGDTASVPADDASLIDNGIIDSTAVLELVVFIEERFDITVGDADIVPANLDSIARISAFIQSKAKAVAA
ncbi:acyl carrier protein [Manganibacter manganicus]|uniref:Acyl carrier protein n=1 Tax=Manganibacter manganicus TaxID=1873176 RepID=A0A1V8RJP5_9HYPH|nr:acyl carrier protein [Pseudaminobacter manganicus]OQM73432.1 acyl carrier protein [Pseudaminobacter manganicus]